MALPTRLTTSPEELWLSSTVRVGFDHPMAFAFSIIGGSSPASSQVVCWVPRSTHAQLFAALRIVAAPESCPYEPQRRRVAREGPEVIYRDYRLSFYPHEPQFQQLAWFRTNETGELGEMRLRTLSGRLWRKVTVDGSPESVLSFWVPAERVTSQLHRLLFDAFSLTDKVRVEFIA